MVGLDNDRMVHGCISRTGDIENGKGDMKRFSFNIQENDVIAIIAALNSRADMCARYTTGGTAESCASYAKEYDLMREVAGQLTTQWAFSKG
jgi:hypothetical protein